MRLRILLFAAILLFSLIVPAFATTYMGYATSNSGNYLTVFDPSTNSVSTGFSTGAGSTREAYVNPAGTYLYIATSSSNQILVYSTSDYSKKYTISGMGDPYQMVMNPSGSRLYVADGAAMGVKVIDTTTNTIIQTLQSQANNAPTNIAYNPDGLVYTGNVWLANPGIEVFDVNAGTSIRYIGTAGSVSNIAYSSSTNCIYAAETGILHVINADTYAWVANVSIGSGACAIAINNNQTTVYVYCCTEGTYGTIYAVNMQTNTVSATIVGTASYPFTQSFCPVMSVNPSGTALYVPSGNNITYINTQTNTIAGTIATSNAICSVYIGQVASENPSSTSPIQVTFNINDGGYLYFSDVNVSIYDAYTGIFIDSDPTDTAGNSIFWLVPGKRYTITLSGDNINPTSQSIQIQPSQTMYSIYVKSTVDWFNPGTWFDIGGSSDSGNADSTESVQTSVAYDTLDNGKGYFAGLYNDLSGSTSQIEYKLYQYNISTRGWDQVNSSTINANTGSANFTIASVTNKTFMLNITGHSSIYGNVYRNAVHTFPDQWPDMTPGWPAWAMMYGALGLILIVALLGSKRFELAIGVGIIITTYITSMLGWTSQFISPAVMFIMLSLMVVVLVIYAVRKWREDHGV